MTRDAAVVISTGSDLFIRYRVSLFFEDESLCCHVEFTPFSLLSRSLFVCERLFLRGGSRLKYSTGEASLGILIRLTASRPADVKRMGFWREQIQTTQHGGPFLSRYPSGARAAACAASSSSVPVRPIVRKLRMQHSQLVLSGIAPCGRRRGQEERQLDLTGEGRGASSASGQPSKHAQKRVLEGKKNAD